MEQVRVLYVDDDPNFAELVARFLTSERTAFEVVTTTDAAAGMDCLDGDRFDCVVSDYQMPERDGLEFCVDVREAYPDLPFILFTSKGSEEIASEAISVGVTDYLQKGSGRERYALLANRLENAVERARSKRRADDQRRINRVVSRINRALVRATSRAEVERRVCEIFAESEPYLFAWIGDVDEADGRIVPRASAGVEEGYLDAVTITADERETGQGPAGVAVKERRVAVAQRIGEDESFSPWREAALERGFGSVAAAPLEYDGEFYGILVVYADRVAAFDGSERDLIADVADDVAHATAAVETRAALRRERDRFEELFEHTTDPIAYCELDGDEPTILDVNPAFEEAFDYDVDDVVGRDLIDLVVPPDRRDEARSISQRSWEGEQVRTEIVRDTPEGTRTFSHQSIPFNVGDEVHEYAIYTDLTETRRRERKLQQERDRFEELFEHTTDPIAYCEFDGDEPIITDVNPSFERVFGYDAEQAVGRNLDDLVVPPNRVEEGHDISRRTRAGQHVEAELVRQTADGLGTFRHQSIPLTVDGETHQYAIYTSVTERRRREATLERLHHATRALYDAEDAEAVAEIVADAARDVLDYPNNVVRLVNDDGTSLRAVAVTDVAHATLGSRPDYSVADTSAGEAYRTGEPVVRTSPDELDAGHDHGDAACVMYVPMGDHGVLNIADTHPDAFDQSDLELARILATNAAAAIDSVEQRRAIARENERLERFAAILSHDLRNPLDVARGNLDLVESDDEHLARVADAHDRMRDIIDDVLTMARQGRTVEDGDREAVSLAGVAREAWRNVATDDATLRTEETTTLFADRSKLLGLLENLFRNSVEHGSTDNRTKSGDSVEHGSTSSRTEADDSVEHGSTDNRTKSGDSAEHGSTEDDGRTDEPGVTVRVGAFDGGFYVVDDGPGFDDVDQPTELDQWAVGDGSSGLGLTIVAELAAAHGWRVVRRNADDGGARFDILND